MTGKNLTEGALLSVTLLRRPVHATWRVAEESEETAGRRGRGKIKLNQMEHQAISIFSRIYEYVNQTGQVGINDSYSTGIGEKIRGVLNGELLDAFIQ